jgi:hypothetical protein
MHSEKNASKRPARQGDLHDSDTGGGWSFDLGTCAGQWISVSGLAGFLIEGHLIDI